MSDGPVRIAHVITRLDIGGAQATAVRTCALLDRERYAPILVAGLDHGSGGSLVDEARDAGIEVVLVPELIAPIRPWADLQGYRALRRLLDERRIELVHTHSSKAGVLGRLAAGSGRTRVHTVHGWSLLHSRRKAVALAYGSIERALARATDALVVVTPKDRETGLAAHIGTSAKYHLVRSGIAVPPMPSAADRAWARRELGWAPEVQGIVAVGRLEAVKDPIGMVDAFASVVPDHPDARLALVGSGDLDGDVAAHVAALGLGDRVRLLGLRTDAVALLAGADGYVLGSRFEGLPRALLEAVAMGVPVVATDVGGIRDVITPEASGLLVPPGDPAALGAALSRILVDPAAAAAMADAARSGIGEFSEEAMAERTMAVYDAVHPRAGSDGGSAG